MESFRMDCVAGFPGGCLKLVMVLGMMNLNEECLLQFLKNDGVISQPVETRPEQGVLTANLKRIFRRNQYVSFPPAIEVRRTDD